jgi:hypothetical protein
MSTRLSADSKSAQQASPLKNRSETTTKKEAGRGRQTQKPKKRRKKLVKL